MESLELIKGRIQSISSTRQITQSMRLISTSRMQKARTRMEVNRPFLTQSEQLVRAAAKNISDTRHPYLLQRDGGRAAVIVINGDRGLCGGYNINVNRHAAALIKSLGSDLKIITIGTKSRDFCRRRYKGMLVRSFTSISENPSSEDARDIATLVQDWYDSGEVNKIYVVYTKFESMLTQTPETKLLLPLDTGAPIPGGSDIPVRCEPAGDAFLARAVTFYLSAFLFGAILESSSCEQSARITSMDSAVKNADEMISALTLAYNQARQGAITQEIIEIVGGADAV